MRGEGAGRAAELAEVVVAFDLLLDALQAVDEDGELLAQGRRRRGLTVRACEHRIRPELLGAGAELVDDTLKLGQPDLAHGGADGEGVGEVVDVLAGGGEVGELGDVVETEVLQASAHEVFDGLDVVAGGRLELGEFVDLGLAEVGDELAQRGLLGIASAATEPNRPRSVSAISHSTSTCTRARLRPASERYSPRSVTAAR